MHSNFRDNINSISCPIMTQYWTFLWGQMNKMLVKNNMTASKHLTANVQQNNKLSSVTSEIIVIISAILCKLQQIKANRGKILKFLKEGQYNFFKKEYISE